MQVYVGRQPIFNAKQQVVAYELLFRSGLENYYTAQDGSAATSTVLSNSFLTIGINEVTGNKPAFINFTEHLLLEGVATIFPKELVFVEILETVEPTPEVVSACQLLKQKGYKLVLDDFVFAPKFEPLIKLADIIKIDFMQTPPAVRAELAESFVGRGIAFLAEKVETREEFEEALELDYQYFQGYFFSKPTIVSAKEVPGFKITYLQLLKEVTSPLADFAKIEQLVKQDVSLPYKLLRLINSSFFGLPRQIESIRQALVMLGLKEIRKWISVISLGSLGKDKPEELIISSLVRARFGELMAKKISRQNQADEFFLTGLFSNMEVLMERPMKEVISRVSVSESVELALLGERNSLRNALDCCIAIEKAEWEAVDELSEMIGADSQQAATAYLEALSWADSIFNIQKS
ncbi:MAG: HDOD domain-containing protein [Calditrichia bacterium]